MTVQLHLLVGIVLIHVVWAVAYATGTLLDARSPRPPTRAVALTELVVRSAAGLALWGFAAFAIGLAGFLTVWGLVALAVAFAVAGRAINGPRIVSFAFWREQWERAGAAFDLPNLALYYAVLLTIVPATFPDTDSDTLRYHLSYSMDWAVHGRIYTDFWLRAPYYANNYLLLDAIFDVLHWAAYTHFLTWLCSVLAVLGTRAAIVLVEDTFTPAASAWGRWSRAIATFVLPLAILVSPTFLRWSVSGMVDVPIEAFVLIPVLCAVAALTAQRDLRWPAVVCAAFFIGMKISLFAFAPLFVVTLWVLVRTLGGSRRACLTACAVLLLASSPWYLRNLIYDHDPIPPVVNVMLHRPDATYSADDAAKNLSDIKTDRSLHALVRLPYRLWADPDSLREYGTVALNFYLYVPLLVIAAAMLFGLGGRRERALLMLCIGSTYALAYVVMTSYLLRYELILQPALAASIGALLLWIPSVPIGAALRVAAAAVALIPSPGWGSGHLFSERWQLTRYAEAIYVDDTNYLEKNHPGYVQAQMLLASPVFRQPSPPRVLLLRAHEEYFFRRAGVETVGDWFGPGRYADLEVALDNDRLPSYVRRFDIAAVIYKRDEDLLDRSEEHKLKHGLEALGFRWLQNDPAYLVAIRDPAPRAAAR